MFGLRKLDEENDAWHRVISFRKNESETLGLTNTLLDQFRTEEIMGDLNLEDILSEKDASTEDDVFIRGYLLEQLLWHHIRIMSAETPTSARRASWNAIHAIFQTIDTEKKKRLSAEIGGEASLPVVAEPNGTNALTASERLESSTCNGDTLVPKKRPLPQQESANGNAEENPLIQKKVRRPNGVTASLLESYSSEIPATEVVTEKPLCDSTLPTTNLTGAPEAALPHDVPTRHGPVALHQDEREEPRSRQTHRRRWDESDEEPVSQHTKRNHPPSWYSEHDSRYTGEHYSRDEVEKDSSHYRYHYPSGAAAESYYSEKDWSSSTHRRYDHYSDDTSYRSSNRVYDDQSYREKDREKDQDRHRRYQDEERFPTEYTTTESSRYDSYVSLDRGYELPRGTIYSPKRKSDQSKKPSSKTSSAVLDNSYFGPSSTVAAIERPIESADVFRDPGVMDSVPFLQKVPTTTYSTGSPTEKWNCQLCDCNVNRINLPRHCKNYRHVHFLKSRLHQKESSLLEQELPVVPNNTMEEESPNPPPSKGVPTPLPSPLLSFPIDRYACNIWADVKEWDPSRDKDPVTFSVKADPGRNNFTSSCRPRSAKSSVMVVPVAVHGDSAQSLAHRLQEWDPFWNILSIVCVGITQPVQSVDPKTELIRTAAQHFIVDDLQGEKYKNLKMTDGDWSNGDRVLLLRMLPESSVVDKRADCHRWPKGTFLQINGKPCRIVQRKQQGHNEAEWLYQSKEYNASSILTKTSGRGCIQICSADSECYYYILTFCEYRAPMQMYDTVRQQITMLSFPQSYRKARAFACQQMSVSVEEDDMEANGVVGAGKFIFTLTCPLSRQKLETPVRGKECKHFQCFDLMCFIHTNQYVSGSRWRCPSCETFVSLQNLESCALTARLLQEFDASLSADRDRIEFTSSGTYKLLEEQVARSVKLQQRTDTFSSMADKNDKKNLDVVVIDIDD